MNRRHHRLQRDARNGNWFVWLQQDGAKRYFNLGPNKRNARKQLEQIEAEKTAGRLTFVRQETTASESVDGSTDIAIEELAVQHLAYVKAHSPDSTFQVRQHYVSMFFNFTKVVLVSQLTNQLIEKFYQWVRKYHSRSPNGGRHAIEELKAFLKWGQKEGLCRNPITDWPKVKHEPQDTKDFSDQELATLLQHMPNDLRELVTFCVLTGLRPQEVRGLTIGNIIRYEGKPVALRIEHHKTSESSRSHKPRSVPLASVAAEIIERRSADRRESACIFLNDDGQPYSTRTLRQRIKRWCIRAGIKPRPTYALRHVFGVKQGLLKTNQAVIAGLMGHSNLKTTTRYMLNIDEASLNAVSELGEHVSRILAAGERTNSEPSAAGEKNPKSVPIPAGTDSKSAQIQNAMATKPRKKLPPKLPPTETTLHGESGAVVVNSDGKAD